MHIRSIAVVCGDKPCAVCSRCRGELFWGEEVWRLNGETVCSDCFADFARAELAPFCTILGQEDEEEG